MTFLRSKKQKEKQNKTRKTFKEEPVIRLLLRSNWNCLAILERLEFKNFVGQPWWPTLLFSALWPYHFEIHFAGLVYVCASGSKNYYFSKKFCRPTKWMIPATLLKKRFWHRCFPVEHLREAASGTVIKRLPKSVPDIHLEILFYLFF